MQPTSRQVLYHVALDARGCPRIALEVEKVCQSVPVQADKMSSPMTMCHQVLSGPTARHVGSPYGGNDSLVSQDMALELLIWHHEPCDGAG